MIRLWLYPAFLLATVCQLGFYAPSGWAALAVGAALGLGLSLWGWIERGRHAAA